jgi:hypothetical protein
LGPRSGHPRRWKWRSWTRLLPLQVGEFRLGVAGVVPVVQTHGCPGVRDFEDLLVTDSAGTSPQRWPVDARRFPD